jgi:hypothetical protein
MATSQDPFFEATLSVFTALGAQGAHRAKTIKEALQERDVDAEDWFDRARKAPWIEQQDGGDPDSPNSVWR